MPTLARHGAWPAPFATDLLSRGVLGFSCVRFDGSDLLWLETRPAERGRGVVVQRSRSGATLDRTPEDVDVRTRVHEYGGGDFTVRDGTVVFSADGDQRLHRQRGAMQPVPITPSAGPSSVFRYADANVHPGGRYLVCVREAHTTREEPANEIVRVDLDGSGAPRPIVTGRDFVAAPRIGPDGQRIAWIAWDHPHMPWDAAELWLGDLSPGGTVRGARRAAGGPGASVFQPSFAPDGTLYVVSEQRGWGNLYAVVGGAGDERLAPVLEADVELSRPAWGLGCSTYAFLAGGRIAVVALACGSETLAVVEPGSGKMTPLQTPFTGFGRGTEIVSDGDDLVAFAAGQPTRFPVLATLRVSTGGVTIAREALPFDIDEAAISRPRPIEFPSGDRSVAHAFYYAPKSTTHAGPPDDRPPLIVKCHGGPTARAQPVLELDTQFWTSRGLAVVDVNYRGSTGYGRAYREALHGAWGVADVEDCVAAARHLAARGEADDGRLVIRGGSAGGFTALSALVFRDVFAAGCSRYGIVDLETLEAETHKFESHYNHVLVGPYPECADTYRERSPVHHADRLSRPVILLQGLEDRVVPPSQAAAFVAALEKGRVPHAYVTFHGEGHGFRRAETVARAIEAELSFLGRVLGFAPAGRIHPVSVRFLA